MTAPKIKALFYLFTANVFNSVQVPRGAPGPATSQHGPSSMAKLKQSDTGAVFGLQELCQVGKKAFFSLYFSFTTGKTSSAHTPLVVTGRPAAVSGVSFAIPTCKGIRWQRLCAGIWGLSASFNLA